MDDLSPEQIKKMISLLHSMLPEEDKVSNQPNTSTNNVIKSKNIDTKSKRKNKFEDMPVFNMHKEDVEIDKKLCKYPPVTRNRKYNPIKVTCRVCGKTESVNPAVVDSVERYKCNKCSSMAG